MACKYSSAHHYGYKNPSEDRIMTLQCMNGNQVFCVFDGHSGQACVTFVSEALPKNIVGQLSLQNPSTPEEISTLLNNEFRTMERMCNETLRGYDGGTTATIAVITKTHVVVAYIGDSPALLFTKKGELVKSTVDHDSKNSSEVERVKKEGGWFSNENTYGENRLFNALSVTRCFGNINRKMFDSGLSAIPDICIWERQPETYLILCSDSFTEKICNSMTGECDKEGNPVKIIANHGTHEEIVKEVHAVLEKSEFHLETTCALAVHQRTMKFYNEPWGKYCGDNTSLILVEL